MARRLVPLADGLGLDGARVCERHGLARSLLADPAGRAPLASVLDVLEALLAATGPAALGLRLAATGEPDAYHTPALILLASECLRSGFERAFRYQRLWGDGDRFALRPARELGVAAAGHAVTFRLPVARRPGVAVLEVCALAETLRAVRGLCGRAHELPLAVGLPELRDDLTELRAELGVPPELGAEVAFAAFGEQVLGAPLPHANAMFRAIFEQQAQAELARLPEVDDLARAVRAVIARRLAQGEVGLEGCASALGIARRTLERRLAERGTSFAALLESVRRELASAWLKQGRPIDEISVLLGYSERSAFHRACLRWFGRTPALLRREPGT